METLHNYLETMFSALPKTDAAHKLKAEMLANMEEKFQDLTMRQGKSEAEAIGSIIGDFGTVEELRATLENDGGGPQKRRKGININDPETGDHVHIGWDGIHVKDHNGDDVRVQFDGVHVEKNPGEDGVESVYVDKHGVYVKKSDGREEYHNHKPKSKAYAIVSGILLPVAVLVYLCLGFFGGLWHPYWMILPCTALLLGSLNGFMQSWWGAGHIHHLEESRAKTILRRVEGAVWPLIVMFYLLAGVLFGLWHPLWAVFPLAGILDGILNTVINNLGDDGDEARGE